MSNEKKPKNKPITIVREEFISSLCKLINESGLPMFAIESILRDIAAETKAAAQKQYEIDKKSYEETEDKK